MKVRRYSLHLGVAQMRLIDALSRKTNVSRAAHIRLAIDGYLQRVKAKEARAARKRAQHHTES